MRITEEVTRTQVVEKSIICDKCLEEIKKERFNAFDFDFEIRFGESYPGDAYGKKHVMDLCEKCSHKLLKDLNELGYKSYELDWPS